LQGVLQCVDDQERYAISAMLQAKCTVLVIQLFLQNCAQPHDRKYICPIIKSIGHMYFHTSILISRRDMQGLITFDQNVPISKNFFLKRPTICFQNLTKIVKKKFSRVHIPHPLLTGLRPSPPPRWVLNVWPQWCWITKTVHFACTSSRK